MTDILDYIKAVVLDYPSDHITGDDLSEDNSYFKYRGITCVIKFSRNSVSLSVDSGGLGGIDSLGLNWVFPVDSTTEIEILLPYFLKRMFKQIDEYFTPLSYLEVLRDLHLDHTVQIYNVVVHHYPEFRFYVDITMEDFSFKKLNLFKDRYSVGTEDFKNYSSLEQFQKDVISYLTE